MNAKKCKKLRKFCEVYREELAYPEKTTKEMYKIMKNVVTKFPKEFKKIANRMTKGDN